MLEYLRRLATTGAAYTASSVLSKLIAVALLPLYTAYLTPSDYGAAEVVFASVIAASIVIRLGVIEALLRFYYLDSPLPDSFAARPGAPGPSGARSVQARVVATGFAALFWTTTVGALIVLPFAGPLSEAMLDHSDPGLVRIGVLGLWTLTLWEYALTLLRVDERARAYFGLTVLNVIATIPVTVWLVVVEDEGAAGILWGSYGTGLAFLFVQLWRERRRLGLRPELPLLRRMVRFGLPTMPAELSLYSLNFIDRILIVRLAGLAEAGLYALAIKFAQGMNVVARALPARLAAARLLDRRRRRGAARLQPRVHLVRGRLRLRGRRAVAAGALDRAPARRSGVLRLVQGDRPPGDRRSRSTPFTSSSSSSSAAPAAPSSTSRRRSPGRRSNVVLNLILIPAYGIVGAGIALVASYAVVLVLMYVLTQRLFPVPYEWGRLALLGGVTAAVVAGGELLLPTDGLAGFASRTALWLALPGLLLVTGFLTREERASLRRMLRPAAVIGRLRTAGTSAPHEPEAGGYAPEVYESVRADEDLR